MSKIDLESVIESAPFGRLGWLVLVLTTLALVFDGFDIQSYCVCRTRALSRLGHLQGKLVGGLGVGIDRHGRGRLGDRRNW